MGKLPFWSFVGYIQSIYTDLENLPDKEFNIAVDETVWPECLKRMKYEGKNLQEIMSEMSPAKILIVIKKYKDIINKEKN